MKNKKISKEIKEKLNKYWETKDFKNTKIKENNIIIKNGYRINKHCIIRAKSKEKAIEIYENSFNKKAHIVQELSRTIPYKKVYCYY
jgi:CRISPR/Cas system-associated endonuclease/helicase Cas3